MTLYRKANFIRSLYTGRKNLSNIFAGWTAVNYNSKVYLSTQELDYLKSVKTNKYEKVSQFFFK
jgi:hypothetical protein